MNATISNNGTETIVALDGRLDTTNVADFEQQIASLYTLPQPFIVFDCTSFTYISSSGLRIFLTLLKYTGKMKGRLVLRHLSPEIKSVFDMTGFTDMFTIE